MSSNSSLDPKGAWAIAVSASLWGFFWYPLRLLDSMGFKGSIAIAMVSLCGAAIGIAIAIFRRESAQLRSIDAWMIGVPMGLSCVLYFLGIMISDVIRVIFLFYLLPIWTMLIARILFGEVIKRIQVLFIVLALIGLWLLLGGGAQLPLPRTLGDWCGFGAGITWGLSLSLLRGRDDTPPLAATTITLLWSGLLALLIVLTVNHPEVTGEIPSIDSWIKVVPLALIFGGVVMFPSMFGQVWGARLVPAPTAALLTMSEIIVATITAYLLLGTELTAISWLGGLLIVGVVCTDLVIKQRDLATGS